MAITGKSGSFKVGAVKVASLKNWKFDIDVDMKDISNFSSNGWKEFIAALKGFTGSVEGDWAITTDTTGQKALQDALLGGTTVSAVFDVDGTHNYAGSVFVKKVSANEPVDDTVKFSCDLQGTGALTYS